MDAGELLLAAYDLGRPLRAEGQALVILDGLPDALDSEAVRLRRILFLLLALTVEQLCDGMTAEEREAFEERAAILEFEAGYPRDLAERVAVWWARTPCAARLAA
jgi:hypothetical protein